MRRDPLLLTAVLVATLVGVVSAGCATAGPQPTPPPPTKTPKPTFTATPDWSPTPAVFPTATAVPATPTPEATATPEATDTPTPLPAPSFTANQQLNVRSGPGTSYPSLGTLAAGDSYDIIGKNPAGDWLEFVFNGDPAWVTASLVTVSGDSAGIKVAQNIPAPPTARPQPRPQPTSPPRPTSPPAPPQPTFDWMYVAGSAIGAPQCGVPHFSGQVQYKDGSPQNGVCVYLDHYGPRQILVSGGRGAGNGNWSFSPCGQGDCSGPTTIYVVPCPSGILNDEVGADKIKTAPGPVSDKFTVNITDKCQTGQWENIIFKGTK
jgi:Bacterial SH3 domain